MSEPNSSADTGAGSRATTPTAALPPAEPLTPPWQEHTTVLLRDLARDTDAAPQDPTAPPAVAGRHQLVGEIARGGIGVVLKGHDPVLGRELAVKVLREDHRDDLAMRRRFLEEAQVGGQLQHPGVVPVYDLGSFDDGRPFFTMKLVHGRTLAELLDGRPDPRADLPRFLGVFEQVCQTIAYAH